MARLPPLLIAILSLPGSALVGCGSGSKCPIPAEVASPGWADANADGRVDLNDGVRIARHELAAGPRPACRGQGDLLGTGDVGLGASIHIWDYLFIGNATRMPDWDDCAFPFERPEPPPCAATSLTPIANGSVSAPAGTEATFEARVSLASRGLDPGPDAWSFGVGAEGCEITAATTAGTVAAHSVADPAGIVGSGMSLAELVDGGAVSAVVPSWLERIHLSDAADGRTVLGLQVSAPVPATGCSTCTLAIRSDLQGSAQPVAAVVGFDGWSYDPVAGSTTIEVCAR